MNTKENKKKISAAHKKSPIKGTVERKVNPNIIMKKQIIPIMNLFKVMNTFLSPSLILLLYNVLNQKKVF